MRYHTTVTSGLRLVARLARASPWASPIETPINKASLIAAKQAERHPTILADHGTRTALRRAILPAVQLVIMPPGETTITLLLLSNLVPSGSREEWHLALDPDWPLAWRNYELSRSPSGAITWRLSGRTRAHYRQRVDRLITGRGGIPAPGKAPYQLSPDTARAQVLSLADHLSHYPGFSGVRADIYDLARHSTRVWRSTHPQQPIPLWPTMPYLRFGESRTAALSDLSHETTGDKKS